MTKEEIACSLEQIAALLELKGENPFKVRAYTNAARAIETFGGNVPNLQDEEAVAKIPGIGKSIALKIKELAGTGSLKYLEDLRAQFPEAILELFSISGLGAKKIKALYDQLNVSSIEQLRQACEAGRVAELPGFGETTQAKICKAIEERTRHAGYFQFGQIAHEAETLRNDLAGHPDALQADIAGSYRRRKEIVHDLDLLVATKKPEAIAKFFVSHPLVESIIAQGPTKSSVRLRSGVGRPLRTLAAVGGGGPGRLAEASSRNCSTGSSGLPSTKTRPRRRKYGPMSTDFVSSQDRSAGAVAAWAEAGEEKADEENSKGARRSRALSRRRSRFYTAGATGKLGRVRSCRETHSPKIDREGEFAGDISLPHHSKRRPQLS